MIKDEIDKNDKITTKHKDGSLKFEIKEDNDNDLVYLGKQPLHAREVFNVKSKKDKEEV